MGLLRFFILFTVLLFFSSNLFSIDKIGIFSGRIVKINLKAQLVRFKVDFPNMKYLNKKDRVEFWDDNNHFLKCEGYIAGKTNDYLLLKVPGLMSCQKVVNISNGKYIKFSSEDLVNNIKIGKKLVALLLKKRLALQGKLSRYKKNLSSHIERVNAINQRFQILQEKLRREWRNELALLEEDRTVQMEQYSDIQLRVDEADHKLEKYRIYDKNLKLDRWSLDTRLYYKK